MSLSSLFPALTERDFRVYYAGNLLSTTGAWAATLAINWLAYRITEYDELWLGLVVATPALPALLLSIPAGALIDRLRVRTVLFAAQGAMMLLSVGLAALVAADAVEPWHLVVFQLLYRTAFTVDAPARHAFVAQLVPPRMYSNAIALNATAFNMARFLGAAAFGLTLAVGLGEAACILLNACSFGCSLVSLLMIRRPREPVRSGDRPGGLLEGLRYARRTPPVRAGLGLMVVNGLFGYQLVQLLPVFAEKVWHVGSRGYEWLSMAVGIGALVGGVSLSIRSGGIHRGRLILRYVTLSPFLLAAFAFAPSIGAGIALALPIGFVAIQVHASTAALIQSSVPDELRGRVMALFTLCLLGAFPLGGLLGGTLAKSLGAPTTTLISAAVVLVTALAVRATHPELRTAP